MIDEADERYLVHYYSAWGTEEIQEKEIRFSDMRTFAFYSNERDWLKQCAWGSQTAQAHARRSL